MNILYLRLQKSFFVVVFFIFLSAAFSVQAESIPPSPPPAAFPPGNANNNALVLTKKDRIASVGISRFEIQNQQGNTFNIAFSVLSEEGVQPDIIYAVNLLKKDDLSIVDQKVYNDTLSLMFGESLHKEISYTAPAYLKGSYILAVEIRNSEGLSFGTARSPEISLNGSGKGVSIGNRACFLSIDGGDRGRYTLQQGVDITQAEMLTLHCPVINNSTAEMSVIPTFQTRYRSTFGKIIGSEKRETITLAPGKTLDFSMPLPKVSEPQAYDAILTFTNSDNEQISAPIDVHYVLRGASATIRNFLLDKDYYVKGDTAQAVLVFAGPADGFPESRMQPTNIPSDASLAVSITNSQKESCISDFSKNIDVTHGGDTEHLHFLILNDCLNPVVGVKIVDSSGKILAQNVYNIQSKNPPVPQKSNVLNVLLYGAVFLIALLLVGAYLIKKRNTTQISIFFGFLVGLSMFFVGGQARAYDVYPLTVYLKSYGGWEGYYSADVTIGLIDDTGATKTTYAPGETINASMSFSVAACGNTLGGGGLATINGVTKVVSWGSWNSIPGDNPEHKAWTAEGTVNTFIAPITPGTYTAIFNGYYSVYQPASLGRGCFSWVVNDTQCGRPKGAMYLIGTASITYTVVAPPVITFTASPSLVSSGGSSVLTWSSTDATSCNASNYWSGAKTVSGTELRSGISVPQIFVLTCTGLGGSSSKTATVGVNTSCTLPWGGIISDGASVTAYQSSSVISPATCVSESRTCTRSNLSGSYTKSTCSVTPCTNTTWSPDPSLTCTTSTLYQTSNCGNTRLVSGTKICPVDGICGPANGTASRTEPPASSLCDVGTPSSVTLTSNSREWTCLGQNGGADSPLCTAKKKNITLIEI